MELQLLIDKWDEIKEIVTKETETSVIAYNTWLKPLEIYDIIDDTVYIIYSEDSESRMIALIEKKYKLIYASLSNFEGKTPMPTKDPKVIDNVFS